MSLATFTPLLAAAQAAPVELSGADTAWMLISTALVLLMTPMLAFFYGGLVRSKNALNTMMMSFISLGFVGVLWAVIGYSLAFTEGGALNQFVGGLSRAFLMGLTPESTAATFSNGVVVPELAYMAFQMTFACITPALIVVAPV